MHNYFRLQRAGAYNCKKFDATSAIRGCDKRKFTEPGSCNVSAHASQYTKIIERLKVHTCVLVWTGLFYRFIITMLIINASITLLL